MWTRTMLAVIAAAVVAASGCGGTAGESDDGGSGGDIAGQVQQQLAEAADGPNGEVSSVECQDRSPSTYACLVQYQRGGEIFEAFYDVIDNGDSLTVDFSSSDDPQANRD